MSNTVLNRGGLLVTVSTLLLVGCGQPQTPSAAAPAGGDSGGLRPGFLTATEAPFTLDLRQTPLETLSAADRDRLSTAPRVQVTLSDGTLLTYANQQGVMLLEGDIALSPSANAVKYLRRVDTQEKAGLNSQGLSRFAPGRANWVGDTVPYYWKSGTYTAEQEQVMKASIARWNEQAGDAVKWVWDSSPANAVQFIKGGSGSCGWSYVGSIGGHQQLAISCFNTHTVMHEMGHAAGLWHEHQRCDRDQYVSIPGTYLSDSVNFGKNCNVSSYGPYDYDSIMNYGNPFVYALSNPGSNYTGDPRNLGRLPDLSAGDISALRISYTGADSGGDTPPTPPSPTPDWSNTFTASLSAGSSAVLPQGSYFNASGSELRAELTGPVGSDFDLYLQGWNGRAWVYLAASENEGSTESITYSLGQGSVRWVVYAYSGAGSFTLKEKH